MRLITLEEHYMSKKVNDQVEKILLKNNSVNPAMFKFINDFVNSSLITDIGDKRIAYMDKVGVDTQILGYGNNTPGNLADEVAIELCQQANNEVYEATQKYPGRFYGYATLPLEFPDAAVAELERCVNELDFVGVMVEGQVNNHFMDDPKFYPILEKCAELDVPLYVHPGIVSPDIQKLYYQGNWSPQVANHFAGYAIGWHYDTGVNVMRMILAGILDKLPNLKIIAGHWGEGLPFYFDRIDMGLPTKLTGLKHKVSWYFQHQIYTDPSGMFFRNDMEFTVKTMGANQIMWAQDFPYLNGTFDQIDDVRPFIINSDLLPEDIEKITHKNAEKLFHLNSKE